MPHHWLFATTKPNQPKTCCVQDRRRDNELSSRRPQILTLAHLTVSWGAVLITDRFLPCCWRLAATAQRSHCGHQVE